jgi:hypothetical protein
MVIASPNGKVNRFSSFAEMPANSRLFESRETQAAAAFRFDSSRCLNCPSNFTGQIIATSRQTATRLTGTSNNGQEPHPEHPVGPAGWRNRMFQDTIDTATALPVENVANGDVLFDLGLMYSTGRTGMVDLVAAHKWFNLAALKGRVDAIPLRREVAEQMTEDQIAVAQREARAWVSLH